MTLPLDETDGLPKWFLTIGRIARYLAPGLSVVYVCLLTETAKRSLTATWVDPPTLIYDWVNMGITLSLVVMIPACGPYAVELLKNLRK